MRLFLGGLILVVAALLMYPLLRPVLRWLLGGRRFGVLSNDVADETDLDDDGSSYWESYELGQHPRLRKGDPSVVATLGEIQRRRTFDPSTVAEIVANLNRTHHDQPAFNSLLDLLCGNRARTNHTQGSECP
ncbi:MAG: hypothetical protein V9E87_06055 [Gemmatimonadales bacterium]